MFANYGFETIVELRSEERPLGPNLLYPLVDSTREWSRRMFVLTR